MIEQILNGVALGVGFAVGSALVDLVRDAVAARWARWRP